MRWSRYLVLAPGVACGAGCRTTPVEQPPVDPVGSVDMALVPPAPGPSRLQLDSSQGFVFPLLLESTLPGYPPELLPLRLPPQTLCVDVDIDAQGLVSRVRGRDDTGCAAAGPHAPGFAAALEAAVRQWRFDPALVCRTSDGRASAMSAASPTLSTSPWRCACPTPSSSASRTGNRGWSCARDAERQAAGQWRGGKHLRTSRLHRHRHGEEGVAARPHSAVLRHARNAPTRHGWRATWPFPGPKG